MIYSAVNKNCESKGDIPCHYDPNRVMIHKILQYASQHHYVIAEIFVLSNNHRYKNVKILKIGENDYNVVDEKGKIDVALEDVGYIYF